MVEQFYTDVDKKYINTIDTALNLQKDLKFALGSGHQKHCSLWVIMKW